MGRSGLKLGFLDGRDFDVVLEEESLEFSAGASDTVGVELKDIEAV